MIEAPIPTNEQERLTVLYGTKMKSVNLKRQFEAVLKILSKSINVPIAYISTIDKDSQDIHASCGLNFSKSERRSSFCGHTILHNEPMIVEDTFKDKRFHNNPLVTGDPMIRFYAGYPLAIEKGINIGSVCIADTEPRKLDDDERMIFMTIGKLLVERIQMSQLAAIHDQIQETKAQLQNLNTQLAQSNVFYKQLFSRYMSQTLLESIMDENHALDLKGEERFVTVMMSDIRGFTPMVHGHEPQEVLQILNIYLETMICIINNHDGYINEILGDGILVIFGAPKPVGNCARKAVECSRAMQEGLKDVNKELESLGLPSLEMGIGINSGKVIIGNIGSKERMKFGVVGENINIASRVQSMAFANQILITESTYNIVKYLVKAIGSIRTVIKGYEDPITIYDVSSEETS